MDQTLNKAHVGREWLVRALNPGVFGGITLGRWLRVLLENDFGVDPTYWGRAVAITLRSLRNTIRSLQEDRRYGHQVRTVEMLPPLFILGSWRSGTTHLFNLLSKDDRFAYPNLYEVMNPFTFLHTEETDAPQLDKHLPPSRLLDNVRFGVSEPQEDELALCAFTGHTYVLSLAFPRAAAYYDRYLTLRTATRGEIAEWAAALQLFVRKLTFRYRRPLVLKSPAHTGRIRLLLEQFGGAKFVHIHRHPYAVFQSMKHSLRILEEWWALQRPDDHGLDERALRYIRILFNAFFEERTLIPSEHYCEVRFEELEKDPIEQVRQVYERLNLPTFEYVEPALRRYLASITGYKKNRFPDLPAALRERIIQACPRCFCEWGYTE